MNRTIVPVTPVPVKPTAFDVLAINRAWVARVDELRALAEAPLYPAPVPVAVDHNDWACLRCGDDVEDPTQAFCCRCERERIGF